MTNLSKIVDDNIRKINDFPKPGILFYDITSVLMNQDCMQILIDDMVEYYKNKNIDAVIAAESRGFIFAAPFCLKMNIPMILARKKGKLPGETISESYDLEYGSDEIEVHKEDIDKYNNILIIDDLIATGGTLEAITKIIESRNKTVAGIYSVIGLPFLNYEKKIGKYDVRTIVNYDSE